MQAHCQFNRRAGILLALLALVACSTPRRAPEAAALSPAALSTPRPSATFFPTATKIPPLPDALPVLLGRYARFSPDELRYDLQELFNRLEDTHPNLYARRTKDEVDGDRQRLDRELVEPMTVIDFYKRVAPLVNSLGDYHLTVALPVEAIAEMYKKERFFPLEAQIEGERLYLTANFSPNRALRPGLELLKTNGLAANELIVGSRRYYPYGRSLSLAQFWLLFGSAQEYWLEVQPEGAIKPVARLVPGLDIESIRQHAEEKQPYTPVSYTRLEGESTGVLAINSFTGAGPLFKAPFAQIQTDQLQHLILDLRANQGGPYDQVDALMDYLTDQPYRQCARQIKAPAGGYGRGEPRVADCELQQPFAVKERFSGKLYLLVGPDTVSAGVTLASILQDYKLATLIGEETSTPASYCGDVASEMLPLPRTHLLYLCPRTCYVRPNGRLDERGVVPDLLVKTSLEERFAGRDPVLEAALALIRSGGQVP